jgi:glutamate/tyrosine decarboxylase-like PLP-dependent enzyme
MPTCVGVGYSLMPSIAPALVRVGWRYSSTSVPKNIREVASTSLMGARGKGTSRTSPLIRVENKLSGPEYARPSFE